MQKWMLDELGISWEWKQPKLQVLKVELLEALQGAVHDLA